MVKYFGFNHVQWPQSECQRFFGDGDDNTDDGCDVDDDNDVDDIFDENDVYGDKCGTLILLGKVSNDDFIYSLRPFLLQTDGCAIHGANARHSVDAHTHAQAHVNGCMIACTHAQPPCRQ